MPELAGRLYLPKLYKIDADRSSVVELLESAIEASGGRVVYSSFCDQRVAPIYIGAEDGTGARYGLLVCPFRATKRLTGGRPVDEHRAQIRVTISPINRLARGKVLDGRRLDPEAFVAGDREFRTGDRVVCLRNQRADGLLNGLRGMVTAIEPGTRSLTIRLTDGIVRDVPTGYIDAGHLDYGYAMTITKRKASPPTRPSYSPQMTCTTRLATRR